MTQEEQLIEIGNQSEQLLQSEVFTSIVNHLIDQSFQGFVMSKPEDEDSRTAVYYQYQALREIIDTMKQRVAIRDEIKNRNESENRSKEEE